MQSYQLKRIHQEHLAVKDKIYTDTDGVQYIGTAFGRLEVYKSTSNIPGMSSVLNTLTSLQNQINILTLGLYKVKVTSLDSTANYLSSKLIQGTNITLTTLNPGANESIKIDVTGGGDIKSDGSVDFVASELWDDSSGMTVSVAPTGVRATDGSSAITLSSTGSLIYVNSDQSEFRTVKTTVTEAQIRTLQSSPVTVISDPGDPNKVIDVISCVLDASASDGAYSATVLQLYTNGTTEILMEIYGALNTHAPEIIKAIPYIVPPANSNLIKNAKIKLIADSDSGFGTGDITLSIYYRIITL